MKMFSANENNLQDFIVFQAEIVFTLNSLLLVLMFNPEKRIN